jgi:hypothetical protein
LPISRTNGAGAILSPPPRDGAGPFASGTIFEPISTRFGGVTRRHVWVEDAVAGEATGARQGAGGHSSHGGCFAAERHVEAELVQRRA